MRLLDEAREGFEREGLGVKKGRKLCQRVRVLLLGSC